MRLLIGLCVALAAMRARSASVSMWIGLGWLAYNLSWIVRYYDRLP